MGRDGGLFVGGYVCGEVGWMYVCMYVYIYIYIYIYVCVCVCVCACMYYIHPEVRIGGCRFRLGKGARPLWREHRGSRGEHRGSRRLNEGARRSEGERAGNIQGGGRSTGMPGSIPLREAVAAHE